MENSWNSPKERCIHTNLTKGGFLGLQWESMEGSIGLFDANEMDTLSSRQLNSQETPSKGV